MLKNVGRFNDIKLAKGLDMQCFEFAHVENYTTARNSHFYADDWYDLPKGRALYKTCFPQAYAYRIGNLKIYNEMICQELLENLGLPHARYEPAHDKDCTGIVSYNMLKKDEILINLEDFLNEIDVGLMPSILSCRNAIDAYISRGITIDKKKFILSLYALCVFDTLTLQTDRNDTNICIIHNTKTNEMRLAPIFDNEYAFCAFSHFNLEQDEIEFDTIIDATQRHATLLGIHPLNQNNHQKIDDSVKTLVSYAKKNPDMMRILTHIVNNIDIIMAIEKVENMGYEADDDYKEFIQEVIDYTTQKFNAELENKKKNEKEEEMLY